MEVRVPSERIEVSEELDLLVVGGGSAGTLAALSAARLMNQRSRLGLSRDRVQNTLAWSVGAMIALFFSTPRRISCAAASAGMILRGTSSFACSRERIPSSSACLSSEFS